MLQDYMEDFILLEHIRQPDGLGGFIDTYEESMAFQGGLTSVMSRRTGLADQPFVQATPLLIHEWGVTLALDDIVRRVSDGVCYRVTGQSSDMRSPAIAGFAFAQVPVERLVTAP